MISMSLEVALATPPPQTGDRGGGLDRGPGAGRGGRRTAPQEIGAVNARRPWAAHRGLATLAREVAQGHHPDRFEGLSTSPRDARFRGDRREIGLIEGLDEAVEVRRTRARAPSKPRLPNRPRPEMASRGRGPPTLSRPERHPNFNHSYILSAYVGALQHIVTIIAAFCRAVLGERALSS